MTWNPHKYPWNDLEESITDVKQSGYFSGNWSCGNTKRIMAGDRLFMLRQGKEPRGIFASGWAASPWYQDYHWDGTNRAALYVDMDLDVLLNPETETILERQQLNQAILAAMHWNTQTSGIQIPNEIAINLENVWDEFLSSRGIQQHTSGFNTVLSPDDLLNSSVFFEGTPKQITTNTFERNASARSACIKHYGLVCSVCCFNFEETYGYLGKNFIHVHHIKPMSEIGEQYTVNPIEDLRPVCPNCHAMLHKRNPPLSIEELQALTRKTWCSS